MVGEIFVSREGAVNAVSEVSLSVLLLPQGEVVVIS